MNDNHELDIGIDRALFERMRKAAKEMQNAGKDAARCTAILNTFQGKAVRAAQDVAHEKAEPE